MSKSYRIRTQVGVDKKVNVLLEQDFESLEILSLKILQNQIYTRQCSDYGVIVGRVSANNGLGIPNVKISVFIPLSLEDENNPIISELYPYKTLNDRNDEGYRYNLLPYDASHGGHTPTGTFPTRLDVLINTGLIEVFDKYYKFNAKTNDSGDFMIFGVPTGPQTVHIDVDLSDIGEFSLSPQDFVRLNLANEEQLNGIKFRSSTNLDELPQIKQSNRTVEVVPLWGEPDICYLGITRVDFDLQREFGIKIEPAAIFMGSIFSNDEKKVVKRKCKVDKKIGNLCSLVTGPGEILAVRHTIQLDSNGRPVLEQYFLDNGGRCIDEDGTWLVDIPMNLDYVFTDEFGNRIISQDPNIGIPTKGRYRFKIKWQQPNTLTGKVLRANYLVPNVKEWGWSNDPQSDPSIFNPESSNSITDTFVNFGEYVVGVCHPPDSNFENDPSYKAVKASYAFSLDWEDYGAGPANSSTNSMISEAILCQDRFFEFDHSKVYTVSQLLTEYRVSPKNDFKYLAIKDILDDKCESTTNTFPANDGQKNNSILYLLFSYIMGVLVSGVLKTVLVLHLLVFVVCLLWLVLKLIEFIICGIYDVLKALGQIPLIGLIFDAFAVLWGFLCLPLGDAAQKLEDLCRTSSFKIPAFTYPDCTFCDCGASELGGGDPVDLEEIGLSELYNSLQQAGGSNLLADLFSPSDWLCWRNPIIGDDFNSINSSIYYGSLATGAPYVPNVYSPTYHAPQKTKIISNDGQPGQDVDGVDEWDIFTTSLPFFERMNLINTKAKYFLSTGNNPGSGYNRAKVRFAIDNPNNSENDYHQDNLLILLVKPSQLDNFTSGKIFTPVEKQFSQDKNLEDINSEVTQFGNTAVTGVTLGSPVYTDGEITHFERDITVSYAKPDFTVGTVTYTITGATGELGDAQNFYKFPSDIEYFQVITGVTVSKFIELSHFSSQIVNRIVGSYMHIVHDVFFDAALGADAFNSTSLYYDPQSSYSLPPSTDLFQSASYNPLRFQCLENYSELGMVFLVRGVDPYSSRQTCSFDLNVVFGHPNFGDVDELVIEGQFKLNIPIQGTTKNVRHGITLTNNSNTDTYSDTHLFYPSYSFQPDVNMYRQYNTNATSYYIRGDAEDFVGTPFGASIGPLGLRINGPFNWFTREFYSNTGFQSSSINDDVNGEIFLCKSVYEPNTGINDAINFNQVNSNPDGNSGLFYRNRGYFNNEIVEGAGYMYLEASQYQPTQNWLGFWICQVGDITSQYYSYSYNSLPVAEINMSNANRIVMRSDRLPTSSSEQINGQMSYALHANQFFNLYEVDDDGYVQSSGIGGQDGSENVPSEVDLSENSSLSGAGDTFSCEGLIPLRCYQYDEETGSLTIAPPNDDCYYNGPAHEDTILENGCYKLVTKPLISLPLDLRLVIEWYGRLRVSVAACLNIYGHIFTNYWINGTLYMFPFTNKIITTGSDDDPPDIQYPCVCPDLFFVDFRTNNIYYRSAPYRDGVGFIGKTAPANDDRGTESKKPNYKNLLFPTTIMNLGPRTKYTEELAQSEEYQGYVMNRMSTSSFQDVSDLLNQFIMSRMISQSLIGEILAQAGPVLVSFIPGVGTAAASVTSVILDPVRRMFSRGYNKVDGDYAQMLAINSQIGVLNYDEDEYFDPEPNAIPSAPSGYVYLNPSSSKFNVFGVFYKQDFKLRDWLSPHRFLTSSSGLTNNECTYEDYPIFTQVVPFYQWYIIENRGSDETPDPDSIFGDQRNDWWTNADYFFTSRYQGMDRLNSGFMQPLNGNVYGYHGGFIYNVDSNGEISAYPPTAGGVYEIQNVQFKPDYRTKVENYTGRIITPSGPYYFYFGLTRGKSAFDRFITKWVETEDIMEI